MKNKKEINYEKTWRKLKWISLSERCQSEKVIHCLIPRIWHSGKGKNMETVKNIGCCQSIEGGRDKNAKYKEFLGQGNYSIG